MAKKSKKSSKTLSYIKYGSIVFGLLGAVMTLLAFVNYGDILGSATGVRTIFGWSEKVLVEKSIAGFSFMNLLAILLPVLGAFSTLSKNKIVRLVGALMMIAGCVLVFFAPNFVVFADKGTALAYSNGALGIGAILAGVFFGLGSLCTLYSVVEK